LKGLELNNVEKNVNKSVENNQKKISKQQKKAPAIVEKKSKISNLSQTDEIGGRKGLEPTRYGDWEKNGRCIDF